MPYSKTALASLSREGTVSILARTALVLEKAREKLMPYAGIPLRLIVGYGFLAHGLAKWSRGPEVFAGILQATGVPMPNPMAWVTIATEFAVGIAFLAGAFVPLASIPAI